MTATQKKTAGIAITSLVFGILGLIYKINPVGQDPTRSVHGTLSDAIERQEGPPHRPTPH